MCVGLTVGYVCGSVYWQVVSYCEGHTCINSHMILKIVHCFIETVMFMKRLTVLSRHVRNIVHTCIVRAHLLKF